MIVVGDDRQGIYGFAGAQSDALEQLIGAMSMTVLPLTVSWRCPQAVIAEAQRFVPDIEHAPDAPVGTVTTMTEWPAMEPTDAILCRNTAPLIQRAYAMIRAGTACRVEGREIGNGLMRVVNRWKETTIAAFMKKLDDHRERETQKAIAQNKPAKAEQIADQCETLVHVCNACIDRKQTSLD